MATDRARKISELSTLAANAVANGDLFVVVDVSANETKKVLANNMAQYFVGLVNKGEKGEAGTAGTKGDKGTKGDQGDKGDQGIQGFAGTAGAKGQKGERFTGAIYTDANNTLEFASSDGGANVAVTGIKGEKGAPGSKGDTGTAGSKGDTGAKGDLGDKGNKGDTSAQSLRVITLVDTSTPVTANSSQDIFFCDPNAAGANVTVILPSLASNGQAYVIKNINPGSHVVLVTSDDATSRIEDVSSGTFTLEYSMVNPGEVQTWVCDNGYYRHIG